MMHSNCAICNRILLDLNTHQCNWAVLEGRCSHPRKWEMCGVDDFESREELLEAGYEPFSVVISPLSQDHDGYTTGGDTIYYLKRIKPCEICKKV